MFSTLGSWDEGIRAFLQNASQKEPQPWDMGYEERRRATHEPRVIRQLELEDEWKGSCMEGIWNGMRRFALPMDDYKVSEACFYEYLASVGINSVFLGNKLYGIFRLDKSPEVDFLRVCKAIHLGLTDSSTSFKFLEHCYKSLPISPISEELERTTVIKVSELQRHKKDQRIVAAAAAELRLQQLEGILQYYEETGEAIFDIGAFCSLFFEEKWRYWAGSFIKQLLEAAAKYFSFPYGVFPTIPLRWTRTTEPLPYDRNALHDADSLLLRNVELTERGNADGKRKGRKHHGRSSKKK
ncbi:hypothetical protein MOQ_005500 [Trypanosoma cruzi marinkellei]|uniref:Uncharacterized protein n=1 Tax=Trypanosoma cruzi marinkellei TaxID=85056 RepID=K2NPA6_TRYCR|nr:hypothetical protein MOQ_005500 [Trypanosoma cruzi marinkellei]